MNEAPKRFRMSRTALVTCVLIITLGIYDLVTVAGGSVDLSVSQFLATTGFKSPFFVFALGYVSGHLTGYMSPEWEKKVEAVNHADAQPR